ncbi:glutamate--cysteine ligase [Romeria aff. gracilis LEGE 07310]|uniref:Glutamate--cysteine ligase n=1 Tax=Vasconcelosia minhoensis LEGE 07310 TaxID=915328 RepID=A0A8J7ARN3_9CYAN|nr:glutamate--cysteine ligase [Romeria gracilis]MBE9079291.1 glutamate--cysteine ligase [Romeria aff. gracilis LEGE 07310]
MNFRFGIEHEVAFLRPDGQFADYANTSFAEFQAIVATLPQYVEDYPQLRIGDAGIKVKRWYIEGYERFSERGEVIDCPPKGIEIRTTVHTGIGGAIAELSQSFDQLCTAAAAFGFIPILTSFHPHRTRFEPMPPLNSFEQQRRRNSPEKQTAHIPMLTQGPDLNLSAPGFSTAQLIDLARKLTYLSPFILPFSYSSPFYASSAWAGLSVRTFYRTGPRPAAMVFLADPADLIEVQPSLTKPARIAAETGRIEFKAFDSCGDFGLYGSLLALLKGLLLDETLIGRATVPDAALHRRSARVGFADDEIYAGAKGAIAAASAALASDPDRGRLEPLKVRLAQRYSPAQQMLDDYRQGRPILEILRRGYSAQ